MSNVVTCAKCGIKLYELVPGTGIRKIFRSFATEESGECTCIKCHEGKNKEIIDGKKENMSDL